jgi:hypothetical protein
MSPGGSSTRLGLPVFSFLMITPLLAQTAASPPIFDVCLRVDRAAREIAIHGLEATALAKVIQDTRSDVRWAALCPIFVRPVQGFSSHQTEAIIGTYHVDGPILRFVARYPLDQPGYRVFVDASLLCAADRGRRAEARQAGRLSIDLDLSKPPTSNRQATTVTAVYPTAHVLPENLLRFYIHFSAPMSRGEAYRHIRLLDAVGKPVPDPFLELDEELWSNDGRRFTLLFDPGRIKRGLKPREEVGPVLEQGRTYTLAIDSAWADSEGRSLGGPYRCRFLAGPPDQRSPSPQDWIVHAPRAGTRDSLELRFSESLDSALARRLITVEDGQGLIVQGQVSLASAESVWSLVPNVPWKVGEYRLVAGTELEDLAGNAINRPFEVDQAGPISRRIEARQVVLSFQVKARTR